MLSSAPIESIAANDVVLSIAPVCHVDNGNGSSRCNFGTCQNKEITRKGLSLKPVVYLAEEIVIIDTLYCIIIWLMHIEENSMQGGSP